MQATPPPRFLRARQRAAALVIVLSLVVLLTGLAVAFFARTAHERSLSNSSVNESRTDLFAQGAIATLIGDLKQEIAAGSNVTTTSGVSVYAPVAANTTPPALALTGTSTVTSFAPNLVKRSANTQPFYAGTNYSANYPASNRAAPLSTTVASRNGWTVSNARWNKGLLLPKANAASATDFTPVTSGTGAFAPPDWVLVARDGSNPTMWNANMTSSAAATSSVVGRFAYAMYDEGGVLDVNAAGYPGALSAAQVGAKGILPLADLTQIGLNQAQVDALVGWRNFASAQATGSFPNYSFASGLSYYNFIFANPAGFLKVGNTALNNGQSDRMFSSRQQLISLLTSLGTVAPVGQTATLAGTQNALQCLGTFSREVNAPSFQPRLTNFQTVPVDPNNAATARPVIAPAASGGNPNTVGLDSQFNPSFTDLRWPAAATITHYNDDGTTATYSVNAGDPAIQRRFSLTRLGWFSHTGPASALPSGIPITNAAAAIQACFGLQWNSTNQYWQYIGADGAANGRIRKLSEVVAANREPDFFELLQGSIDIGSLGLDGGAATGGQAYSQLPDQNTYLQVMQIGANVIDQTHADSFPTHLNFAGAGTDIYGVEDIPYLYRVYCYAGRDPNHAGMAGGWYMPELWNPYASENTSPSMGPTHFRVIASNNACAYLWIKYYLIGTTSGNTSRKSTPYTFTDAANAVDATTSAIVFDLNGTNTFLQPTLLTPVNASSPNPSNAGQHPDGSPPWIGIFVGDVVLNANEYIQGQRIFTYPWVGFQVQYQESPGAAWQTCSQWKYAADSVVQSYGSGVENEQDTFDMTQWYIYYGKTDPRTDRWSEGFTYNDKQVQGKELIYSPKGTPDGFELRLDPPASADFHGTSLNVLGTFSFNSETRSSSNNKYYSDPDGVVRRGDAMYAAVVSDTNAYGQPMNQVNTNSRPVVLHRPFRAVGELGYAFRDMPWKSLDLMTSRSADSALLDVFSVADEPALAAGTMDANGRDPAVFQSLISGAAKTSTETITSSEAASFAAAIVSTSSATPFHNRSDLVNRLAGNDTGSNPVTGDRWGSCFTSSNAALDQRIKTRRESVLRSLSGAVNTRTWNLLIDVIAQTGRYAFGASKLQDFTAEGQKRYWVHVAIDRYTGKVVDEQVESVQE